MEGAGWLAERLSEYGCAACGQPYQPSQVRLLAEREDLCFVDLTCAHCGTQAVAIVTVGSDDAGDDSMHAGELVLVGDDGAPLERRPASAHEAISADDVIAAHALLREFRGDARALLARLEGRDR